jgi:hypothetical protein
MDGIALRPVGDGDLDALFDQMRDPEGCGWLPSRPRTPVTGSPCAHGRGAELDITLRAVTRDGQLVGSIAALV